MDAVYFFSTRTRVIVIGVRGASPSTGTAAIAATTSAPPTTRAKTEYWLSRGRHAPMQMKNDVDPLPGSVPRAIETTPGTLGVSVNSGGRFPTRLCCLARSGAVAAVQIGVIIWM